MIMLIGEVFDSIRLVIRGFQNNDMCEICFENEIDFTVAKIVQVECLIFLSAKYKNAHFFMLTPISD